ncbi:ABC transporter permease [Paenibacillus sp. NFR01]|uniref:ABC transporter permease n=1 Tax=Paenibacillus sp. NFR01 TaxID=1566279 RepID=UPI0008AB944F|nr:ABC transporter permease [Paenibacillus sp. NFR01]SET86395.1 peptide/nickel transport system permease protein [Paenibacillus sp. NFR01]
MAVAKFIVKRLFQIVITLILVMAVSYIMMYYSPGGFLNTTTMASVLAPLQGQNPILYQQVMDQFQSRYGLNLPLWQQIAKYVWNELTFNFGNSMQNPSLKIMTQLKDTLPISVLLAFGSVLVSIFVGVPMGIIAALKRNSWVDYVVSTISLAGQAIPAFVLAVIMVLIFGVAFPGILPITGWGNWKDAVLPIICLSAANIGVVARYMRGSLIETLRQDYIRTAKAKGVKYWPMVMRHGVKNSLTAMITVIGPQFAFTVMGTIWVEQIFAIPGLGKVMQTAFTSFDYPLAITSVFLLGSMIMIMNLLVDIIYVFIDPRVKL